MIIKNYGAFAIKMLFSIIVCVCCQCSGTWLRFVDTISSGKVPCLDNAVVALANLENQAAVQEALKVYQSGMEEVSHAHCI